MTTVAKTMKPKMDTWDFINLKGFIFKRFIARVIGHEREHYDNRGRKLSTRRRRES